MSPTIVSTKLFSSVQSLSPVQLFTAPWPAACQASLSITKSQSLLKLVSIKSVMPSNQFILCPGEDQKEELKEKEALLLKWFQGKWKNLALRQRSQGTRPGPFDWLIHCISLDFSFLESSDLNISNVSFHFNAITLKKETGARERIEEEEAK